MSDGWRRYDFERICVRANLLVGLEHILPSRHLGKDTGRRQCQLRDFGRWACGHCRCLLCVPRLASRSISKKSSCGQLRPTRSARATRALDTSGHPPTARSMWLHRKQGAAATSTRVDTLWRCLGRPLAPWQRRIRSAGRRTCTCSRTAECRTMVNIQQSAAPSSAPTKIAREIDQRMRYWRVVCGRERTCGVGTSYGHVSKKVGLLPYCQQW